MNQTITTVPGWIYRMEDYVQVFDLKADDFSKKIFDYPGATSSFNAQMTGMGHEVVTGDALYSLNLADLKKYVEEYLSANEEFLRDNIQTLKEKSEVGVEEIFHIWKKSTQLFLHDFEKGKKQQRYQSVSLPKFPFEDHQFDLALCRDLLFHTHIKKDFKQDELISELCRVAHEVRVYPLHDEYGKITEDLGRMIMILQQNNFGVEVREVQNGFKVKSNAMLRIWAKECIVED